MFTRIRTSRDSGNAGVGTLILAGVSLFLILTSCGGGSSSDTPYRSNTTNTTNSDGSSTVHTTDNLGQNFSCTFDNAGNNTCSGTP